MASNSVRKESWRRIVFDQLEGRQLLALTMTKVPIIAAQNNNFTGIVADLFVLGAPTLKASPADFNNAPGSVQINWGDGQSSSGTVVGPVGVPGTFEVTGSHLYTQPGTYSVFVDVSDTSGDDASALSTANVAAQPFPLIVNAISGAPDELLPSTGIVASFISSDGASAADLSVLINWGDGQTTIGSILQGPGQNAFSVVGSYSYATAGTFTTIVTVSTLGGLTSTGVGQADIASAPVYPSTSAPIFVTTSQLFTKVVGTFTDPNSSDTASNFTGAISWGDGNTSPVAITGSNGSFSVGGTYTYNTPGVYAVTVTISDQSSNTFTISNTAQVASIDLSNNMLQVTGGLALIAANGPRVAKGYTNTNQPVFSGTAAPFSIIQLYARPFGIDTEEPLGETVTSINGQWSLAAGPLLAGTYNISAIVTPSAGAPSLLTPLANNGLVHIDMVPKASKAQVRHQRTLAHHKVASSPKPNPLHHTRVKHRRD
jgi:Bacterial Ig-like domain